MKVSKKYVVYELNNIMDSEKHKSLEEVSFSGWISNNFESEEEAIQALIDDGKVYDYFLIIPQIYITDYKD